MATEEITRAGKALSIRKAKAACFPTDEELRKIRAAKVAKDEVWEKALVTEFPECSNNLERTAMRIAFYLDECSRLSWG